MGLFDVFESWIYMCSTPQRSRTLCWIVGGLVGGMCAVSTCSAAEKSNCKLIYVVRLLGA